MTIIKKDGTKNRLIVDQLGYGTGDSPTEGSSSVVLSSDADYTLSNTQYNAQIIFLTSSVSLTAPRNIIVPLDAGSDWMIRNYTTGGQSVIIKGSTGTGVTIDSNESVHVFTDGVNVYAIGGLAGPVWNSVDIDFTTYATTSSLTDGVQIGNSMVGWKVENSANTTTFQITNGTGLVITLSSAASELTGSTRSAPMVTIPLSTLASSLNWTEVADIRISAIISTTNMNENFESAYLCTCKWNAAAGTDQRAELSKVYSGALGFYPSINISGSTTGGTFDASRSTDDILVLHGYAGAKLWNAYSLASSGGNFPTDRTGQRLRGRMDLMYSNISTPLFIDPGDLGVMLAVKNVNAGLVTPVTVTYKKLRIEWRNVTGPTGPVGATGPAGASAYTTTNGSFTQPSANGTVAITVLDTSWMSVGGLIFIETGGTYEVTSIGGPTSVTIKWLGYDGTVGAGGTVATGKKVMASGVRGATGAGGIPLVTIAQTRVMTNYPHTTWSAIAAATLVLNTGATNTFKAVLAAPAGFTMNIRLCDLTAGGTQLVALSTSNTSLTSVSGTFTPTDNTNRIYTVEIKLSGTTQPSTTDIGVSWGSYIEVT